MTDPSATISLTSIKRLDKRHPEEIDVRAALKKAAHVTDIRIEGAILIALLAVWRADEIASRSSPQLKSQA